MKLASILGLNARNRLFSHQMGSLQYSASRAKKIARSKILTKRILQRQGVATPQLYKVFRRAADVYDFCWEDLPGSFALKPSKGFGGEGIIVVKKKTPFGWWITTQRKRVAAEDLKLHTLEILEGAYSTSSVPDVAFCEEYVGRHNAFRKLAFRGTPDIRIIVFNKVPVMAMLRLPTLESAGRANLHQGAIGVGIDIATGITTYAIWHGEYIRYKPETKRKLNGLRIPFWDKVLETAIRSGQASVLGLVGVDIVLHPQKGPLVLELNSQPGLMIQLVNKAGLRKRLERVEDLQIKDAEHGIRVAKALFASPFTPKVKTEGERAVVNVSEQVKVKSERGQRVLVSAKLDTGAYGSSIDEELAKKLGLLLPSNILWIKNIRNALGQQKRSVVGITFYLMGKKISTVASVVSRKGLRGRILIGRRDLKDFLVSPARKDLSE